MKGDILVYVVDEVIVLVDRVTTLFNVDIIRFDLWYIMVIYDCVWRSYCTLIVVLSLTSQFCHVQL
jgi:hypothetical protein